MKRFRNAALFSLFLLAYAAAIFIGLAASMDDKGRCPICYGTGGH